jgi:hypothetical protein
MRERDGAKKRKSEMKKKENGLSAFITWPENYCVGVRAFCPKSVQVNPRLQQYFCKLRTGVNIKINPIYSKRNLSLRSAVQNVLSIPHIRATCLAHSISYDLTA